MLEHLERQHAIAARGYAPETTLGELVRDTPIVQPVTAPHPVAS